MPSIQTDWLALDTNQFIFALRQDPNHPACTTLLFEKILSLHIYVPLQVLLELQQNLRSQEMRQVFALLELANRVQWDYTVAPRDLVEKWKQRGAKQGDATIAAYLEAANIPYLISENRDFLVELPDLPFTVLSSQEALHALG